MYLLSVITSITQYFLKAYDIMKNVLRQNTIRQNNCFTCMRSKIKTPSKIFGVYGGRVHLFPFRTEKLRLLALMVLPF